MSSYLHQKGIERGLAVSGAFEITSRCNFNCSMCYVHNETQDALSAEQWLNLGSQARDAGLLFLLITGGEPLLREDFEKIYLGLQKLGFMISINTNGSLIKKYILLFKKHPPFRVNVSLYGGSDEAYKRLCKNACFETVTDNIKALCETGVDVRLNSVFTRDNESEIEKIVQLSKDMGLHLKSTAYAYPPVRLDDCFGVNPARTTPEEAGRCKVRCDLARFDRGEYARRAKAILNGSVSAVDMDCSREEHVRCRAGRASFWLTSEGVLRPCGMMTTPQAFPLRVGFAEAWEQIKAETEKITMPLECSTCARREICPVCPAICFAETGRFNGKPDYVCRMMESVVSRTEEELEKAEREL